MPDCTDAAANPFELHAAADTAAGVPGAHLRLVATLRDPGEHGVSVNGVRLAGTATFTGTTTGPWGGVSFLPQSTTEVEAPVGGLVEVRWDGDHRCRGQIVALGPGATAVLWQAALPVVAPKGERCGLVVPARGIAWEVSFGNRVPTGAFSLVYYTTPEGESGVAVGARKDDGERVGLGDWLAPLLPGLYTFSYDAGSDHFIVGFDPTYANGTVTCPGPATYVGL